MQRASHISNTSLGYLAIHIDLAKPEAPGSDSEVGSTDGLFAHCAGLSNKLQPTSSILAV